MMSIANTDELLFCSADLSITLGPVKLYGFHSSTIRLENSRMDINISLPQPPFPSPLMPFDALDTYLHGMQLVNSSQLVGSSFGLRVRVLIFRDSSVGSFVSGLMINSRLFVEPQASFTLQSCQFDGGDLFNEGQSLRISWFSLHFIYLISPPRKKAGKERTRWKWKMWKMSTTD